MQDFFYRCAEWATCDCKYDICRLCALINSDPPVLEDRMDFSFHDCEMKKHIKDAANWKCNAWDLKSETEGAKEAECLIGMKNAAYSKYIQGYHCGDCDFNMCLKCVLHYKDTDYKKPKKLEEPPPAEEEKKDPNV